MTDKSHQHNVRFELEHGRIRTSDDEGALVVPLTALRELTTDVAVGAKIGGALGRALGSRIAKRLGASQVHSAPLERVASELTAEFALHGLGTLALERWGYALVIVLRGEAFRAEFLGELVRGAVEAASGSRVWCLELERTQNEVRLLLSSASAVDRVRAWLANGIAWGDAITRLHSRGGVS